MSTVIRFNDVTKKFGRTVALDRVSLTVPQGVVFAFLGENGAGKTTAIRNLLGLQIPDAGSVQILGLDPQKQGVEVRRRVGYVPDDPAIYDWMTVTEIAWFTAGFYPEGFSRHFFELAARFELPIDRKIKQLSRGGRAKVTLALAMAHQPELLILDEPTSGLDTMVRREFLESMVDVASQGRTVLLSSHQIPEVERVADHVAIINEGRVLVSEKLETLKQQLERWVITFDDAQSELPSFDAAIMTHEGRGHRRQQLVVRNPGPNALWNLRDDASVNEVEVHTPSLEEIFVAFIKSSGTGDSVRDPHQQRAASELKPDGGSP